MRAEYHYENPRAQDEFLRNHSWIDIGIDIPCTQLFLERQLRTWLGTGGQDCVE